MPIEDKTYLRVNPAVAAVDEGEEGIVQRGVPLDPAGGGSNTGHVTRRSCQVRERKVTSSLR